ncbi:uL4 family ribosomal protein [Candidatus Hodgkinia cicadicola]
MTTLTTLNKYSVRLWVYPRLDVISEVVRFQLNKRRWYVAQIKSRANINHSKNKRYPQKGFGRARHATNTVCQFRGGGKYSAKKACVHTQINKKLKKLAMRSCLSLKLVNGKLFVLDSFLQLGSLTLSKPIVVYFDASELLLSFKQVHKTNCVHWSKLSVLQVMLARELVMSARALEALAIKLRTTKHYAI